MYIYIFSTESIFLMLVKMFFKINHLVFLFLFVFSISLSAQNNVYDICRKGNVEDFIKLYKSDTSIVNRINDDGYTPLTLACYYGNEGIVEFLVDKVESINGTSKYGTPLMAAVVKGNKNITSLLLKNKANPDIKDENGTTAAHYAVMFKNYDIIKLLLEAKANFNLKNLNDKSAVDYAIMFNDDQITKLLKL